MLRAQGRQYCVGGDLRDFVAHSDDIVAYVSLLAETVNAAVETLVRMPVPVVVAVHGAIAGAGLGLALSGDLCVAGASSRFSTAHLAVGRSPDAGVTALLPRAVGPRHGTGAAAGAASRSGRRRQSTGVRLVARHPSERRELSLRDVSLLFA